MDMRVSNNAPAGVVASVSRIWIPLKLALLANRRRYGDETNQTVCLSQMWLCFQVVQLLQELFAPDAELQERKKSRSMIAISNHCNPQNATEVILKDSVRLANILAFPLVSSTVGKMCSKH